MNFEEKLNEFKALDANAKKEKLIAIFEYAKDNIDFSQNAIDYLTSNEEPEELVMENLYEFIVSAIMAANDRIEKENEKKRDEVKQLSYKEAESEEKDAEDAEKLLDLINLL